jgi:toxoflavin synthase
MTSSTSQYDDIASSYTFLYGSTSSALPCALLEESNLKSVLVPYLTTSPPKRILDLACGSGYYSRLFLTWGAASIVGVDLSEGMIAEAKRIQASIDSPPDGAKITYLTGDATDSSLSQKLKQYDAPFDIVTGTWLLNYAPDLKTLTAMFATISSCLKPDGVFIGLTIPPPLGNEEEFARELREDYAKYGETGDITFVLPVDEESGRDTGFATRTQLGDPNVPREEWKVEFNNYSLRNWVFEKAAKDAGLGELEWQPTILTEEVRKAKPTGYWNIAIMRPGCRVCVVRKGSSQNCQK